MDIPKPLTFRGDARKAATLLLTETSLANIATRGLASRGPVRISEWDTYMEVFIFPDWAFSSGEAVLLDLLRWMADIDLTTLDEQTQRVAFRALVLSTGRSVDELAVGS